MKEARVIQAKAEIQRLFDTVSEWKELRIPKYPCVSEDNGYLYRGQHNSQINAITHEINETAQVIKTEINNLDLNNLSLEQVYALCTQTEQRCVWLWRVFEFFRSKFDQREDIYLKSVLQAADEIVWSCYKPFFQNSGLTLEPAPLPFIAENYSPAAIRKNQMPGSLRIPADFALLKDYLNELPIPILQLPPNVVTSHWALVLIGHEVGHFIQPLIAEDYENEFSELLADAVKTAGGDDIQQQYWREWSPEVFADWYSVLMMGQWALWAMLQFEFQERKDMVQPRGRKYPSVLARLHLLAHLVDAYIPHQGSEILERYGLLFTQLDDKNYDEELNKIVPSVAKSIFQSSAGKLGQLGSVLNFEASDYVSNGRIERYADDLLANKRPIPNKLINTARYYASGIAQAWSKAAADESSDLYTVKENLKGCLGDIIKSAPDGTRSAVLSEKKKDRKKLLDFIDEAVEKEKH